MLESSPYFSHFSYNPTSSTHIYTLSLHDALPISLTFNPNERLREPPPSPSSNTFNTQIILWSEKGEILNEKTRSEEHTSELQSRGHLVCRLLLEKKKLKYYNTNSI